MLLFGFSWHVPRFPALPSSFQVIENNSEYTNYSWYCNIKVQKYDQNMNTWNRHIHTDTEKGSQMFINIGTRKIRNTYDSLLVQVRNFYLPFWVLGFSTWGESDTISFYDDFSIWLLLVRLRRKLLVWPRRAPKIDLLRPSPNLNFFVRSLNLN